MNLTFTRLHGLLTGVLVGLGMAAVTPARASFAPPAAYTRAEAIRHKLENPGGGIVIVAHGGCHDASPAHGVSSAPENSLAALEHCVRMGVDMMATDVRRSKDGALIIMHDTTVDRTTNGTGRVADLTLVELKRLRLRENFGGKTARILSKQTIPTLRELLAAARGLIILNLDIEEDVQTRVITAIVAAGMTQGVLVRAAVGEVRHPMADQLPYSRVMFMPVIVSGRGPVSTDLGAVAAAQIAAAHRIPAVATLNLSESEFSAVAAATRWGGVRLWADVLPGAGMVGIVAKADNLDLSHDDAQAWAILLARGVTVLETDEPAALMDYVRRRGSLEPRS